METTKNSNTGKGKENKQSSTNQSNNTGFDFSGLLNDKNLMEILKHLLSGGGAMAGSFLMWIKPLQEKIEAMYKKITEQEKQIKELQEDLRDLSSEMQDQDETNSVNGKNKDYFNLNKEFSGKDYERERSKRRMRSQYL